MISYRSGTEDKEYVADPAKMHFLQNCLYMVIESNTPTDLIIPYSGMVKFETKEVYSLPKLSCIPRCRGKIKVM